MTANKRFMIYGANGYTGAIISRRAKEKGFNPVLAGRNEKSIQKLSAELNLEYRIFSLHDPEIIKKSLENIDLVIHAAGPFAVTAEPMMNACIHTHTHYVDITGEIEVFEMAKKKNEEAISAGIIIMPGAGFDVVPTDCLSLYLKKQMPEADRLHIAFVTVNGGLSHGTASTMVKSLGSKGFERINGELVKAPVGRKYLEVEFEGQCFFMMSIPWGDLSTAYTTTGIPNIVTYTGVPASAYTVLKFQYLFNWLLRTRFFRNAARRFVDKRIPSGPPPELRKHSASYIYGEVFNSSNDKRCARLTGPDGYTMTGETSLLIAENLLMNEYPAGYHTPASIFGEDFILQVPGVNRIT